MLNTSRYRIIAIGKVRRKWIQEGINLYMRRLPGLTITELRDSDKKKEEEVIRKALNPNELLITLAEEGEHLSSITSAQRLENISSSRLAFVIGGADGITSHLKELSHWSLSLSPMTFPHEMARLILVEQLYRAQTILQNTPYHRE